MGRGDLIYNQGFGNEVISDPHGDVILPGKNSPQKVPRGLVAEQLSGSAFTVPRFQSKRTWLYRKRPSVARTSPYEPLSDCTWKGPSTPEGIKTPNQLRWGKGGEFGTTIREGLFTVAVNPVASFNWFQLSKSAEYFASFDSELVFLPVEGELSVFTECGKISAVTGEILVIPRGMKWKVINEKACFGYALENTSGPLTLPNLGPIGANGLANPRDFQAPVATWEDENANAQLVVKFEDQFFQTELDHSPLDVHAWHGNYYPYKYNLELFNTIGTVSFDHPDPSIFTVLTSQSEREGIADLDFVIFPPRWMVGEDTFRPPYFHRNYMSELMGLLYGQYDAKEDGFVPGGVSIHNMFAAHGPEKAVFDKASSEDLAPVKIDKTMAFMFESRFPWSPLKQAFGHSSFQKDYWKCWQGL